MDFYQTINKRRSSRKFTKKPIPRDAMMRAFDAAINKNSSNMQTWNFYWVRSEDKNNHLRKLCLSQSAAREAQELVVTKEIADPSLWRRSNQKLSNTRTR